MSYEYKSETIDFKMKLYYYTFMIVKPNKFNLKKLNIMKKYFAIFALLFASIISVYGMEKFHSDSDSIDINLVSNQINPGQTVERTMDFIIIEACAYPSQGIVEVTLYNIGSASVSLINSNGQVVSSEYVQTDTPTVVYLDTFFTSGTYYIEIVSDTWYAEGVVTF